MSPELLANLPDLDFIRFYSASNPFQFPASTVLGLSILATNNSALKPQPTPRHTLCRGVGCSSH